VLALLVLSGLDLCPSSGQSSDEEKRLRQLFLKSRQEMEIVPSPTPTPKPTPAPAPSPSHRPPSTPAPEATTRKAATPEATPSVTPSPTPAETPTPPSAKPKEETTVTPPPTPPPKKKRGWWIFGRHEEQNTGQIVIQKSGAQAAAEQVPVPQESGRWTYLTPAVRRAIDEAPVARNRWKYIIVHNSGTRQGNARIFDYYHRHIRKMPNGLAYHFVIGNGTSSGNGQIEIGNRWVRQLAGGHVHSDYLNYISIGICLVGDFNRDLPTRAQYLALEELISYLRQRVGKIDGRYSIVLGHK
jgi:hypothetical protein